MDRVRRCFCGRKPDVATCYDDGKPGWGPFFITCNHGKFDVQIMTRSWSKTRVVRNWNRMVREELERLKFGGLMLVQQEK
jgi:hypothetical protein